MGRLFITKPKIRRPLLLPAALTLSLLAGLHPAHAQQETAPKVAIAAAYMEDVVQESRYLGRGEAISSTDIVARVTGFVEAITADDGARVTKGDTLFEIEAASYEASLASRQAELSRAEADLELARIELDRKEQLVARDAAPLSELDIARANEKIAEAQVVSAQAAVQQAELELSYTSITAPFDGRVGRMDVSIGALVGPSSGPLVSVVSETPIYVQFSVSEPQLADILERFETDVNGLTANGASPDVFVELPNGTMLEETGRVVFIDNQINPATGTIAIRAEFDNTRAQIIDGAFVNVQIQALEPTPSLLVPQAALQRDQRGDFVLIVTDQGLVEQRYVTLGIQVGTAMVIEEGMRPGESVIVEGLQRVRPGVSVNAVLASQNVETGQ